MSGSCPVDTHSPLLETFCLLQPMFSDFLRTLLGIWRNSFWILSANFTKKCVFSQCLLFSWHFIGYTFTRQEKAYSTTIFLQDRCRRHYWLNSITWSVVMQYKSLETYRFRDTWTFYKLSFFKETKGYFCLHSIPGRAGRLIFFHEVIQEWLFWLHLQTFGTGRIPVQASSNRLHHCSSMPLSYL